MQPIVVHRPCAHGSGAVVDLAGRSQRCNREHSWEEAGAYCSRCAPQDGPSRYERRRVYQSSLHPEILSPSPRHLGAFEGERKRLMTAMAGSSETLARDIASFVWLCAFLIVLAFVAGAL